MQFEWRDQAIQVREIGAGPTVILLHGYPLDGAMWSGVARSLSGRFRVLKPDLPGHGENTAPAPRSISDHADFVAALVSAVPGPAGLAAFSMGGYIALELLLGRPPVGLGALALVDTRAEADDDEGRRQRDAAISSLETDGVGPVAENMPGRLLSAASAGNADLLLRVRRIISRQPATTLAADLAAMRDRRDSTGGLGSLAISTLVVVGEEDALTPPASAEKLASSVPGAGLVRVPAAGHLTPMERPGAVSRALGDFFSETLKR